MIFKGEFFTSFTLWDATDDDNALPDPGDVEQGKIGDCYLIAAMAALAEEHPERLRSIIPAATVQANGAGHGASPLPCALRCHIGLGWGAVQCCPARG